MSSQLSHGNTPQSSSEIRIILVAEGIHSPANIGSLFRLADAFGIERIIFTNAKIDLGSSRLRKTARSTEIKVPHNVSDNILIEAENLKGDGFELVGLEITSESISIDQMKLPGKNVALFVGNEKYGLSDSVIAAMDSVYHINRYGDNSSMNVSHAAAIAMYCLRSSQNK